MYVSMYLPSTDHSGVASEGLSKLHRHVAQTSQPNNPKLMVWFQPELIHGRVYGDAGAEERRRGRQVEVRGDLDHEGSVYHDTLNAYQVVEVIYINKQHTQTKN